MLQESEPRKRKRLPFRGHGSFTPHTVVFGCFADHSVAHPLATSALITQQRFILSSEQGREKSRIIFTKFMGEKTISYVGL